VLVFKSPFGCAGGPSSVSQRQSEAGVRHLLLPRPRGYTLTDDSHKTYATPQSRHGLDCPDSLPRRHQPGVFWPQRQLRGGRTSRSWPSGFSFAAGLVIGGLNPPPRRFLSDRFSSGDIDRRYPASARPRERAPSDPGELDGLAGHSGSTTSSTKSPRATISRIRSPNVRWVLYVASQKQILVLLDIGTADRSSDDSTTAGMVRVASAKHPAERMGGRTKNQRPPGRSHPRHHRAMTVPRSRATNGRGAVRRGRPGRTTRQRRAGPARPPAPGARRQPVCALSRAACVSWPPERVGPSTPAEAP